jgi:hypothetical protein
MHWIDHKCTQGPGKKKPEGKSVLGRLGCRWEDNIATHLTEMG